MILGLAITSLLGIPAAVSQPLGGVCQHVGQVRPSPGLGIGAKNFRFSFRGNVGPCQMADGSTRWGVEYGAGKANGDCVNRTATATWTIVWNTGKRSVIAASFGGAGNVIHTSGPITKGEFKGAMFQDAHFLSGFNPMSCTTPAGVTRATYQGAFAIVS